MRLLLVTGAGASRSLNGELSDPIVLMDGWAAALRTQFGEPLSELVGLNNVRTGEEFEELLGELTRWLALKALNLRFASMTSGTDEYRDENVAGFENAWHAAEHRGNRIQQALDESLFEQFGPGRFDPEAATIAYNTLLSDIGDGAWPEQLICASTNYDRSLELALRELNIRPRTGFEHDGLMRPRLSSEGLGTFEAEPSVLYLHGAVGWYHDPDDGSVIAQPAEDRFRPDMGRPAVMYPSKSKVVEESTVAGIWDEFDQALTHATHVLVLGHGLGDDHLVRRLASIELPLAVTAHAPNDVDNIQRILPAADVITMEFGPVPKYDRARLRTWVHQEPLTMA